VLRQGLPLDSALEGAASALHRPDDRAFALAIAAEVLRRLPDYDALIDGATRQRLPDDAKARNVLRIALAQTLALGTPSHAAISTALALVDGGPRRLVHGVFGALTRGGAALPARATLSEPVAARWRNSWGEAMVAAAGEAAATLPPLDLTLADHAATEDWAARLGGKCLLPGHVRLDRRPVAALPGYDEGAWWVQDIAASIPARLLGPGNGREALDLCAAPGGKTMQLAAAGWRVTAIDRAESRLSRLSENLARTGLSADIVAADVMAFVPAAPVDAVLLDAPCSSTGIFRRHPDVLHRVRDSAIAGLADAQAAMLARVADWVTPGGRLAYAVCSLEPVEGEAVVKAFLEARPDFTIDPAKAGELPDGIVADSDGQVRVLPGQIADPGGADGFFIARLARR